MKFRSAISCIEALESRIAPALVLANPLADLVAGIGKTGASVDLSKMFDAAAQHANRTVVQFTTNYDTNTALAGIQPGIIQIELYDDLAPLTVQNFLSYVSNKTAQDDYFNTFFHRAGSLSGTSAREVLQGGGFELNAKNQPFSIPKGPELHNEYRNDTPNARGTISMAKTGLSPNTATSEFFINLVDNSTALGSTNNGGFTVFGKITDATLAIVDAIGNLPTRSVVGSFGAPVQNYNADPDNNPSTPAPAPTADQVIRITKAEVLPNTPGNATGVTYTIENVFDAGTTTPSTLVTGKITGSTLGLAYKAGASGAVDITVKGSDGTGSPVTDTFRVTVKPNLIANFTTEGLPIYPVPGDSGNATVKLANNAASIAKGKVDVHFFLAETVSGSNTLVTPLAKTAIGDVLGQSISLASGGTVSISKRLTVPADLVLDPGKQYRVIAEVVPSASIAGAELFSDDNTALDGQRHQIFNQFGTVQPDSAVPARQVPITFTDTDGDRVTISLSGSGLGELTKRANGEVDLAVFNTNAQTRLNLSVQKSGTGDGDVLLNDISIFNFIGSAGLGSANANGFVILPSGVGALTLGDLTGPGSISIGAALPENTAKATISLGRVKNYSLESGQPIASLTAIEWLDTDAGTYKIDALTIDRLNITGLRGGPRGDLQAGVNIGSSAGATAISVAGFLTDSVVTSAGDFAAITLGGIDHSSITAGAQDPAAEHAIRSFTLAGIAGFSGNLFVESNVTAKTIGSIALRNVSGTGAADFGITADAIKSYNRVGGPKLANLDDPDKFTPVGEADRLGSFRVRLT